MHVEDIRTVFNLYHFQQCYARNDQMPYNNPNQNKGSCNHGFSKKYKAIW